MHTPCTLTPSPLKPAPQPNLTQAHKRELNAARALAAADAQPDIHPCDAVIAVESNKIMEIKFCDRPSYERLPANFYRVVCAAGSKQFVEPVGTFAHMAAQLHKRMSLSAFGHARLCRSCHSLYKKARRSAGGGAAGGAAGAAAAGGGGPAEEAGDGELEEGDEGEEDAYMQLGAAAMELEEEEERQPRQRRAQQRHTADLQPTPLATLQELSVEFHDLYPSPLSVLKAVCGEDCQGGVHAEPGQ